MRSGAKINVALQGKGIPYSSVHFASNTLRYNENLRLLSDTIGNGNNSSALLIPLILFTSYNNIVERQILIFLKKYNWQVFVNFNI